MIENSERGITINKNLAYVLLTGLVGLGFYGGTTITGVQKSIDALNDRFSESSVSSNGRELRLRALEHVVAQTTERTQNTKIIMERIDSRLDRIERRLDDSPKGDK